MASAFDDLFARLKDTADALILANTGIQRAAAAAQAAHGEYHDLRETVERHEALILAQGEEQRSLRQQLRTQSEELRALRQRLDDNSDDGTP